MFLDGLEDAYDKGRLMGTFAEDCAQSYAFTREEQDAFALTSLARAQKATRRGRFCVEIIPLTVKAGKTERVIAHDELPLKATPDKIPHLKPAFREGGTVTAANSSAISDGAAALVLMRRSEADRRGLKPLATIVAHASYAEPARAFSHRAHRRHSPLAERTGWSLADVDLFEINEAFAVVAMAAMRDLGLPHEKVNVHGGACALGHPIGASGARILVTLLAALAEIQSPPRHRRALHRRRRSHGRRYRAHQLISATTAEPSQFGDGCSIWSITIVSTGPFAEFSFRPISWTDVRIEATMSWYSAFASLPNNALLKSNEPLSPVSSSTGRCRILLNRTARRGIEAFCPTKPSLAIHTPGELSLSLDHAI